MGGGGGGKIFFPISGEEETLLIIKREEGEGEKICFPTLSFGGKGKEKKEIFFFLL